jgi:hypothetical protein
MTQCSFPLPVSRAPGITVLLPFIVLLCHLIPTLCDTLPRPQSHFYGAHTSIWHRFSYPSLYLNVCGRSVWNPVAVDGSVLIRRFEDSAWRITALCSVHDLTLLECLTIRRQVEEIKSSYPDEYSWILSPVLADGHRTFEV